MKENNNVQDNLTEYRREEIKQKLRQYYDGRIVRKDLTKSIREGANVPELSGGTAAEWKRFCANGAFQNISHRSV